MAALQDVAAPSFWEQPGPDMESPLQLLQRRDLSAEHKAKTLLAWARCPEELRSGLPWVPRIAPDYLVQLLLELERQTNEAIRHDCAALGFDVPAVDLSPLVAQARALAGDPGRTGRVRQPLAAKSPRSNGQRTTGASVPLLDPIETSCIEALEAQFAQTEPINARFAEWEKSTEPYDLLPKQAQIRTATKRQSLTASLCFLESSDPRDQRRGDKISGCSNRWGVKVDPENGEVLSHVVERCKDKFCPVCSERRAREVRAWVRSAVSSQLDLWDDMRYVLLTLTAKNVPVNELGNAVDNLRQSFTRLTRLKEWPGKGYVAFLEVTRGENDSAHPHLHVLTALHPEYFTDRSQDATYLPWNRWVDLWQQSLRVAYRPVLDIRPIRPTGRLLRQWRKGGRMITAEQRTADMCIAAVNEVCKYPLQYNHELLKDHEWFRACARELRSKRQWCAGGIFSVTVRAAKQQAQKESDRRKAEIDQRRARIIWYKWNDWDYVRARPHQEREWSEQYYSRRAMAKAWALKRATQKTRGDP